MGFKTGLTGLAIAATLVGSTMAVSIPSGCKKSSTKAPSGLPSNYPKAKGSISCSKVVKIKKGKSYDGGNYRFDRGSGFRPKDCINQEAPSGAHLFELEDGATLKNAIIGREVNDAVYCMGACKVQNVWWEEICEDALTMKGSHSKTATISGGGARGGTDKTFQHNSGGTMKISNFDFWFAKKGKGKFYRSCGGCGNYKRHVVASDITIHNGYAGEALVGINSKNGDTAKLSNIKYAKDTFSKSTWVDKSCKKWGKDSKTYGPDSKYCLYKSSDIKFI